VNRGTSDHWEHWYRRILPAYWLFLFVATHLPRLQLGGPPRSDIVAHLVAFGLLAFLYWRFAETFRRPLSGRFVFQAAAVLLAYSTLDEYLQQFVGRTTAWSDWLANAAGVLGVLTVMEWRRRRLLGQTPAGTSGG